MPPQPARRSRLSTIVAVAAAVALVVAGGVELARSLWSSGNDAALSPPTDPALVERLGGLDGRLQAVEAAFGAMQQELTAAKGEIADSRDRIAAWEAAMQTQSSTSTPDVAGLTQRLDKIEGEIAALRKIGPQLSTTTSTPDVTVLTEKIAALETQLVALQARPQAVGGGTTVDTTAIDTLGSENAQLRNDLGALKTQLDALSQAVASRGEDAGGIAFVLAVGNLGSALATARPFAAELNAVTELAAKDPALSAQVTELTAPVAARASVGVPTLVELRARFPQTARAIVDAAKQSEAPPAAQPETRAWYDTPLDWLSAAGDFVTSQVSVRPVGDVAGDDAGARVARAEVRLSENALAAAVAEVEGVTGAAAAAAEGWLADARARLAADQAVAALQAAAVTRLGSGAPGATDAGG